jgi:hypothetical protein
MPTEDLNARLAHDAADAELAYYAQRYTTIVGMVHRGDSDRAQLQAATRRLQTAAVAWCASRGHGDAP